MSVWFTSDLHLGHRLVAAHRGFGDQVADHDMAICDNWRRSVRPTDQVWVLGDVAVSSPTRALEIIGELPGVKHLIAGNHDGCHPMHRDSHRRVGAYLEVFSSVQPFARRRIGGREVLLSHFPYERDRGASRYLQYRLPNEGRWLLHGHTHGSERLTVETDRFTSREIHVGLDAWGLKPVSINTVAELMREGDLSG